MTAFERLVDDALALLWETQPVTASFAGESAYDAALPAAGPTAIVDLRANLDALAARLEHVAVPDESGARLDARFVRAFVEATREELVARPRVHDPTWYTGEATFGIVALLLRTDELRDDAALRARIAAIPDFLDAGRAQLRDRPLPLAWIERARGESSALERLLCVALSQHPWAPLSNAHDIEAAVRAARRFATALGCHADAEAHADPACGSEYLGMLMQRVHGLHETPADLERRAASAFEAQLAALDEWAARSDPSRTWRDILGGIAEPVTGADATLATYRAWHARALDDARDLLSPASDYSLTFAPLPHWARAIADDLYFLFYRSPPARSAGTGSTYWVDGEASVATIKLVHAVHHGSIGHHTQNAHARGATSRFAQIAGTDGARALCFPSAGTLVEGWACYAEDLMAEVPGFYTPAERLQLEYFTLRNIACCLADVRLHTGVWSLEGVRRFYRDEAGFAPARIHSETTRNSIFPGSRLMYWTGTTEIAAMRARSQLPARAFHARLLSFGSAPVAWIHDEMNA